MQVTSKEFGRLYFEEVPTGSNYGLRLWYASYPLGEIFFNEIREEYFSVWYFHYKMKGAGSINIQNEGSSSIALSFTLKKNIQFGIKSLGSGLAKRNHYNLTYIPEVNCDYDFKKGEYAFFGVEFSEAYLSSLSSDDSEAFSQFIRNIVERRAASITAVQHAATSKMMDIVDDLSNFRIPGEMKKLYIKSRVMDLLRLSIENIISEASRNSGDVAPADEKKLCDIKTYLIENLFNPGTLPEIAHRFGINEFKLKVGFKALFQRSVIAFVHEERLKLAKAKIGETGLPMKIIANEAGYRNISNFTTAFRKMFGYPPGYLKRMRLNDDE